MFLLLLLLLLLLLRSHFGVDPPLLPSLLFFFLCPVYL